MWGGGRLVYIHDKSTRLFHTEFVQLHAGAQHGMKLPKPETILAYRWGKGQVRQHINSSLLCNTHMPAEAARCCVH